MMLRTLLIIEDETNIRKFVFANLQARGYQVIEAENGQQGLHHLRTAHPDALILDIRLPDMTGWDILKAMSVDPNLRDIPVILMTASVSVETDQSAIFPNVSTRLTKPISAKQLVEAVRFVASTAQPAV